jgi:hypothetical protein
MFFPALDSDGDTIMAGAAFGQTSSAIALIPPTTNILEVDSDGDTTMPDSALENGQPKCGFPFLRLPGELRNRVYFFALIAKNRGLKYSDPGRKTCTILGQPPHLMKDRLVPSLVKCGVEFNQLKYTCRQIYKEAKGLELRYTGIAFVQQILIKKMATLQFFEFAAYIGSSERWITKVAIDGHSSEPGLNENWELEPVHQFVAIATFCRRNPQASVNYIFEDLCYEDVITKSSLWRFLLRVHFISLALRDTNSNLLLPGSITSTRLQSKLFNVRAAVNRFRRHNIPSQQWETSQLKFLPATTKDKDLTRVVRKFMGLWTEANPGQTRHARARVESHLLEWYRMGF